MTYRICGWVGRVATLFCYFLYFFKKINKKIEEGEICLATLATLAGKFLFLKKWTIKIDLLYYYKYEQIRLPNTRRVGKPRWEVPWPKMFGVRCKFFGYGGCTCRGIGL